MHHPDIDRLVATHGLFLRREARDLGYHDTAIDSLLRAGAWRRIRWGSFTFAGTWDELDDAARYGLLCRAALRRSNTEVVLSHHSAVHAWAAPLWDVDLSEVHLTRTDRRCGRRAAGIVQHRGVLLEDDVVELDRGDGLETVATTSATRAALEITTLLDVERSLVVVDDLLHRGLTSDAALASRYALMNSWPHTLHTDLVLSLADGGSESVGETRMRYLCWAQHLPAPRVNYPIRDEYGRERFRVDFAWPELRLFVEFDGRTKYERHRREGESVSDCVLREKRREDEIRRLTGWSCLRVDWSDLAHPRRTADRIRALFCPIAA